MIESPGWLPFAAAVSQLPAQGKLEYCNAQLKTGKTIMKLKYLIQHPSERDFFSYAHIIISGIHENSREIISISRELFSGISNTLYFDEKHGSLDIKVCVNGFWKNDIFESAAEEYYYSHLFKTEAYQRWKNIISEKFPALAQQITEQEINGVKLQQEYIEAVEYSCENKISYERFMKFYNSASIFHLNFHRYKSQDIERKRLQCEVAVHAYLKRI